MRWPSSRASRGWQPDLRAGHCLNGEEDRAAGRPSKAVALGFTHERLHTYCESRVQAEQLDGKNGLWTKFGGGRQVNIGQKPVEAGQYELCSFAYNIGFYGLPASQKMAQQASCLFKLWLMMFKS